MPPLAQLAAWPQGFGAAEGFDPFVASGTNEGTDSADAPAPAQSWRKAPEGVEHSLELEQAMRELRDEVRALRESMQGLRERIRSQSPDSSLR